jgi:chromosome segregation ATPase
MNTQWLDALGGLDKMVVGSIVGSIVLAFLLLVAVFSLKIRAEQNRIARLREAFEERVRRVQDLEAEAVRIQEALAHAEAEAAEAERKRAATLEELATLEHKLATSGETIEALRKVATRHQNEKGELIEALRAAEEAIAQARSENEALLKRNEFWVEQLSELRTKYEALKRKTQS